MLRTYYLMREIRRYLPVTQALRLISIKFDGKKSELREFIASVETAIEIVNPNERQLFLKFVESKITGDAKTKLLARPDRRTWEETKAILEENYTTRRTIDFFACKLFNSRQGSNEGVAGWGSRIDAMSSDVTEAMMRVLPQHHHQGAVEFLKLISKACFIQGLQDERIQTVVRARDEKMLLPNAVEIALEEESAILSGKFKRQTFPPKNVSSKTHTNPSNNFGSRTQDNRRPSHVNVVCFRCNKEGHISKECKGNMKCNQCFKWGHEARTCRNKGSRFQGNGTSEHPGSRGSQ